MGRWWPCAPCCPKPEQQCLIGTDDFNRLDNDDVGSLWYEAFDDSGWRIEDNTLQTNEEYDIIRFEPHSIIPDVKVWAYVAGSVGDQLRIIVCYIDQNEYLYAQVEIGTNCVYLSLWKKESGSDTQIGETFPAYTDQAAGWHLLMVCFQAATYPESAWISARLVPSFSEFFQPGKIRPYIREDVDVTESAHVALGTGTMSATDPHAKFDDFNCWVLYLPEWPNCPTCDEPIRACLIYADNFNDPGGKDLICNWDEVEGSEYIEYGSWGVSGVMYMVGGPTIAQCLIRHPTDPIAERFAQVRCRFSQLANAVEACLYIDYESPTNWHRVTVKNYTVPSSVGLVSVHRCVDGVETLLGSTPIELALNLFVISVCMKPTQITANVAVTGSARLYTVRKPTTQVGGKYAALGSLNGTYGWIAFDDFYYYLSKTLDWPECGDCDSLFGYCGGCWHNSEPPSTIQVTFSGYAGACTSFNGTHVLPYSWVDSSMYKCVWTYTTGVWGDPAYRSITLVLNAYANPILFQAVGGAGMWYTRTDRDVDCGSLNLDLACVDYGLGTCCATNPGAHAVVIGL